MVTMDDRALFIQRNAAGQFVGQIGNMGPQIRPNPETASEEETFETLSDLTRALQEVADDTPHGFCLRLSSLLQHDDEFTNNAFSSAVNTGYRISG